MADLTWRKSSHSGQEDNCVEVAALPSGGYAMRDSKAPAGPILSIAVSEWKKLLAGLKSSIP